MTREQMLRKALERIRDYCAHSPMTQCELNCAAWASAALAATADPWKPPEDRAEGFRCLMKARAGVWHDVTWIKTMLDSYCWRSSDFSDENGGSYWSADAGIEYRPLPEERE